MDPMDARDEELRRRLEAYADLRLRPDDEAMSRIKARVIASASQRSTVTPQPRVVPRAGRRWRFGFAALAAAAALAIAVGGAAAMSDPGEAFYGARLWLEQATLPSNPGQRAEAELRRLEARLSEAQVAAARGDKAAVAAALLAYEGIVDETLAGTAGDLDRIAHLESELAKHLVVLGNLVDKVPAQAQDAIQHAITQSGKAIDKLHDDAINGNPTPGGPDASPGNPHGSPAPGGPDASPGNPNGSPDPSHGNPHPSKGPDASHAPGGPDGSPGKPSPKPDKSVKP